MNELQPLNNYLQTGVDMASSARDYMLQKGGRGWNDSWRDFAMQYALAEQEYGHNLELWNLMNEYNSPKAQMQRYQEAGLNPMLVYSQGTPGNASSQATYQKPSVKIQDDKDRSVKVQQASEVIGMVSNLAMNINNLINAGYDTQLKRNEVLMSDNELALMQRYGQGNYGGLSGQQFLDLKLNPLSQLFDPQAFRYFSRNGQLPQFWNNYLTGISTRELQGFRSQYQQYYNENLLPKLTEYEQGKIDLLEIEKELQNYQRTSLEMLPPQLRGIIEPLVNYLSPFLKFIFKSSRIQK